jgi:hypothetical protein
MKKTIMIMVDGFGVPPEGWGDSVYARDGSPEFAMLFADSLPLDACLGIDGVPQSATGQTALFTGVNAAEMMGAHVQGFPGPSLRKIIRRGNIFSELKSMGMEVAFANAYVNYTFAELAAMRTRSVTTIMTESVLGKPRAKADLIEGDAVYHDLTRATIARSSGVERISPEIAASHLADIAGKNDFTLFEYFLTDRAGHGRAGEPLSAVLADFSAFFIRLIELTGDGMAVLLTSDHGNCESPEGRGHTTNPVPLFTRGFARSPDSSIRSITDVFGFILQAAEDDGVSAAAELV